VCTDYALEHVVASPFTPAGGSQGTGQDLTRSGADVPVRFLGSKIPVAAAAAVAPTPGTGAGS
jgi:hypothetical protein